MVNVNTPLDFPVLNTIKKSVQFAISKVELGDTYTQVLSLGFPTITWTISFGLLTASEKTKLIDIFSVYDTDAVYFVQTYIRSAQYPLYLNSWSEIQKSHRSWVVEANFTEKF